MVDLKRTDANILFYLTPTAFDTEMSCARYVKNLCFYVKSVLAYYYVLQYQILPIIFARRVE